MIWREWLALGFSFIFVVWGSYDAAIISSIFYSVDLMQGCSHLQSKVVPYRDGWNAGQLRVCSLCGQILEEIK